MIHVLKKMIKAVMPSTVMTLYSRFKWRLVNRPESLDCHHDYWKELEIRDDGYYRIFEDRSRFLVELVKKHANPEAVIFEIGCSVGMNLNALWNAGFKNLAGLEINEKAVERFKVLYPEVVNSGVKIIVSSIEQSIKLLPDKEYDVVVAVRTLAHVHKSSDWVMNEIARITKDILITIEVETPQDWKHFPRNYKDVFEACGMIQIEEPDFDTTMAKMSKDTVVRVFKGSP